MTFGGTEALLVPWYAARVPARVVTETPSDLQTQVPLLRLAAVGGTTDPSAPMRLRVIRWVIHSYAAGAPAAAEVAEQAHAATMSALRGATLADADVTLTSCESAPAWVPYADTVLRQYVATYNAHILLH